MQRVVRFDRCCDIDDVGVGHGDLRHNWYDYLTSSAGNRRRVKAGVAARTGASSRRSATSVGTAPSRRTPSGAESELNLGLLLFIPYRAMEREVLDALA